jgi:hypothetical protein
MLLCLALAACARPVAPASPPTSAASGLDPAAWGTSHAGTRPPDFVRGDECLFCHRSTVGVTWKDTSHGAAVRHREDAPGLAAALQAEPALAPIAREIEYFLGSRNRARLMKQTGVGTFALLDARADLDGRGGVRRWIAGNLSWDGERFARTCAGCHSTGVDPATSTFSAFGIDCYACHGDVSLEHTKDRTLIWWSAARRNETDFEAVQSMTSICAQCHLRGGRSSSTDLPYPSTFIAGDNLFKDFSVDFARADDPALNPGDRHVYRNVRDVAFDGSRGPTCTTCHRVHAQSSARHRLLPRTSICSDCHEFDGPAVWTRGYVVDSPLCEYEGVRSGH